MMEIIALTMMFLPILISLALVPLQLQAHDRWLRYVEERLER